MKSNQEEYIEYCLNLFKLSDCKVWFDDNWDCINIESPFKISEEILNSYLNLLGGSWLLGIYDEWFYYYICRDLELDTKNYMRVKNLKELI